MAIVRLKKSGFICKGGVRFRVSSTGKKTLAGSCKSTARSAFCVVLRSEAGGAIVRKNCHRTRAEAVAEAQMNKGFWHVSVVKKR